MKFRPLLLTVYVIVSSSMGQYAVEYDGMTQGQVARSLTAMHRTPRFVDKATYDLWVSAHTVPK